MIDLRLGDCLELMRAIPDASVDAVITDPPYGIGFMYHQGKEIADNPLTYWEWMQPMYQEMMRVLKEGGLFGMWQAQTHFRYFWDWFGDDIHIYVSAKNFVQLRKMPINYGYEPVIMKFKGDCAPLVPKEQRRSVDFFVANAAGNISKKTNLEKAHPCPRQLDAVEQIVDNFSIERGTILDPFMGSGTTGVACARLNRNFIGMEINPQYFEIAQRRVAEAQAQLTLPLVTA